MRTRTIVAVTVVMVAVVLVVSVIARATTPHTKLNADVCRQMYKGKPVTEVVDLTGTKGTQTPQGLYWEDGKAKMLVTVNGDKVASFMCSMPSPKMSTSTTEVVSNNPPTQGSTP